jgi:hypothetical protein
MPNERTGFAGLVTSVPALSADISNENLSTAPEKPKQLNSPLLGMQPKSNYSDNLMQVILDIFLPIITVMLVAFLSVYAWNAYCDREYSRTVDVLLNAKIVEKKPTTDSEQILGASEILYCLAERQRLLSQRDYRWGFARFRNTSYSEAKDDKHIRCDGKRYYRKAMDEAKQVYDENIDLYIRQGELR